MPKPVPVAKLFEVLPVVLRDLLGLLGAGLFLYGVWQIYVPAAFCAAGVVLVYVCLMLARDE